MRLPRYLLVSGTAALMVGTLTLTVTATAPAGAGHVGIQARFVSAARNALARYLRHYRPQLMLAGHPHARGNGPVAVDSFNWSGYADGSNTTKAGTFTRVSGSWTTPSVKCGAEDQLTSEWVGLDGWISSSLEQLGTMSWCYRGAAVYFTWWEMFPTGKGLIRVGNTLKPGDKITASVTRSGANYTLKLTDATTPANSFTTKRTCPATTCTDTSAEWIAERPAFGIGIAPLAHYNAFSLTNGKQTSGGKAGTIGSFATVNKVTMIDATQAYSLNAVSSLTSKNSSFSTTWQNSY
jgi:peptidase A4-like protein